MTEGVPAGRGTPIGTIDPRVRAHVDETGSLSVAGERWKLGWWVGGPERWYRPEAEASLRQSLVGAAPVVRTAMRSGPGDVVQWVYAVRSPSGVDLAVLDFENQLSVPVAVAVVVGSGAGPVRDIELADREVRVDGRLMMVMAGPPGRLRTGDDDRALWAAVAAGDTMEGADGSISSRSGTAGLAAIIPVAHRSRARVVVPLPPAKGRAGSGLSLVDTELPSAEQVAAGWASVLASAARVDLPSPNLVESIAANRAFALIEAGALVRARGGQAPTSALGALSRGLGGWGHYRESLALARLVAERQGPTGRFGDGPDAVGETGRALIALVDAFRRARAESGADDLVSPIAHAARWLSRAHRRGTEGEVWHQPGTATAAAAQAFQEAEQLQPAQELKRVGRDLIVQAPQRETDPGDLVTDRVKARLTEATPTRVWAPTAQDLTGGLRFLDDARLLLVAPGPGSVAVIPGFSPAWHHQPVEAHRMPVGGSRLSFAVRWHGDRPALLWEITPAPETIEVTAPSMDPAWSSTDASGEALLAAPVTAVP